MAGVRIQFDVIDYAEEEIARKRRKLEAEESVYIPYSIAALKEV